MIGQRRAAIERLTDALLAARYGYQDAWVAVKIAATLSTYSNDLIERLTVVVCCDDTPRDLKYDLSNMLSTETTEPEVDDTITYLYPSIEDRHYRRRECRKTLNYYRSREWFPQNPDADEKKRITNLLLLTYWITQWVIEMDRDGKRVHTSSGKLPVERMSIDGGREEGLAFDDDNLARLIYETADGYHLILATVHERQNADYETIREVLESGRALGAGAL